MTSSASNSDDIDNLNGEQANISMDQPPNPQDLVYEEPDNVAIDENGNLQQDFIDDLEVDNSPEKPIDEDPTKGSMNPEEVDDNNPEQEDDASVLEAELLDDDSIVYAPEDLIDEGNAQPLESLGALTEDRCALASAEGYQNVDALFDAQAPDPLEDPDVGGLSDINDPARASVNSAYTAEDHIEAEELVVVNVDHDPVQQEGITASAALDTSAIVPTEDPGQQLCPADHPQVSEPKENEDTFENDVVVEQSPGLQTNICEESIDPNMHPAIAQAIRTRNDPFPLLDDPKLPHTRENFNLPPLVEGHSVPVDKGTYQDYIFDLERQEYLQKEEVTKAHTEYLERHHELKQIVSDFLTSILIDKPSDVYQYAADYFSVAVN